MTSTIPTTLTTTDPTVSTRALRKRYGDRPALEGLELTVPQGAVYAFVGPNGSGKTTTFKILLDLVRADSGAAEVLGRGTLEQGAQVRASIGYVPETTDFGYGWMSIGDLLQHHAAYFTTWDATYAARLVRELHIDPRARFGKLSKGESRRVQLVMALAHWPALLLLDEPTDGLDPLARDQVLAIVAEHLASAPTTALVSTHLVHVVEGLADHIGVLQHGRLVAQAERETLDRFMRCYRAAVPEGWHGAPALEASVLRRKNAAREIAWTVWGEQEEVTQQLADAGAEIREVQPLTLEDAAIALLAHGE